MLRTFTPTQWAALAACAAFAVVTFWYRAATPLTPSEVDQYMRAIESQPAASRGALDVAELRRFLATDDGLPFYNVNLFKFREQARYHDPLHSPVSGAQAFARYSEYLVPALPKHASHVVFGSTRVLAGDWDIIGIARYRSRRDLAELFASPEFARAVPHKWAAIDRNVRVVVQARGLFASAYLPVAACLGLLVLAVYALERVLRARRPRAGLTPPVVGGL